MTALAGQPSPMASDVTAETVAPLAWQAWLDGTPRPGWSNMAIDSALLDLAGQGEAWLRLYRWDPFCLSFGRHEPALRRYDREAVAARGLDTVRRPTGGRAVWHAEALTYAVAAPADAFGDLTHAYRRIHAMLQRAVQSLGIPARLAAAPTAPAGLDAGACFASPAGGEVGVGTAKVVGSAQFRQGSALLQHGSLLLAGDQNLVAAVSRGPAPAPRTATLSALLGRTAEFADVAHVVMDAAQAWPGRWHTRSAMPDRVAEAARRHEAQFQSSEWTWQR